MASSPEDPVSREDTEALLEVRRELGLAYEKELVDSFAERIEAAVAQRVDAQVAARNRISAEVKRKQTQQLVIAILSLVAVIPISIVLGVTGNFGALLVSWIGIVMVNVAHSMASRYRP